MPDLHTNTYSARKIYLATSWRNTQQPALVELLRSIGHEVYDFRVPSAEQGGFHWSEVDPDYKSWTAKAFADALVDSAATHRGFSFDKDALDWCNTCVLLLPCGRSAHLEAGYAVGRGKRTIILLMDDHPLEPELMYLLCDQIVTTIPTLIAALRHHG